MADARAIVMVAKAASPRRDGLEHRARPPSSYRSPLLVLRAANAVQGSPPSSQKAGVP